MRIGPLGIWEILIILVVVLLIFGPRRLPEMAKGIGQSVREFRKGLRDMKDDFEAGSKEEEPAPKKVASTKPRATDEPATGPTVEPGANDEHRDAAHEDAVESKPA